MKKIVVVMLIIVFLVSGCVDTDEAKAIDARAGELLDNPIGVAKEQAITNCERLCLNLVGKESLANGPCLSDSNPDWVVSNWVCDVVNTPRSDVDNQIEDQCQDYRNNKAKHFVEFSTTCKFVRAV